MLQRRSNDSHEYVEPLILDGRGGKEKMLESLQLNARFSTTVKY